VFDQVKMNSYRASDSSLNNPEILASTWRYWRSSASWVIEAVYLHGVIRWDKMRILGDDSCRYMFGVPVVWLPLYVEKANSPFEVSRRGYLLCRLDSERLTLWIDKYTDLLLFSLLRDGWFSSILCQNYRCIMTPKMMQPALAVDSQVKCSVDAD